MRLTWLPRALREPLILGAVITIAGRAWLGSDRVLVASLQQEIFGESAAYERFMGRWSSRLAPLMVQFAGIRDGHAVLDVGSGTGALAFAIAEAVPSARITGVDPSAAYVAYARARATNDRLRFAVGDAQQLQFPDRTFERVLSLLVMNFIPDPAKALREMIRVTRPGGVIAAAVWDYGDGMQMLRVFWDEAIARDPAIAARDERHMPLCGRGELSALWRAHGLEQVEERPLTIQQSFASFEDYWSPFLGGQGPAGVYVASLTEAARAELRLRLRRRLLGDGEDRAITLEARAWAVKGVAPGR
jgi:SAM-dependent methyltransferase